MPACTFNIINFGEMNKKHFNSTFIIDKYSFFFSFSRSTTGHGGILVPLPGTELKSPCDES